MSPWYLISFLFLLGGCSKSFISSYPLNAPLASPPASSGPLSLASTCMSSDPEFQCLGLKVISYQDENGVPSLQDFDTFKLVEGVNEAWKPCKIGFQIEKYEAVKPGSLGLAYSPNWRTDSTGIRATFDEPDRFLMVAVGPWTNATIAVTQMPGNGPFGTLVSLKYAKNALTVGHELGHYMGLYHLRDAENLMNPYIGPHTLALTPSQCETARKTNSRSWQKMMRGMI